jgi:hypothetical protein
VWPATLPWRTRTLFADAAIDATCCRDGRKDLTASRDVTVGLHPSGARAHGRIHLRSECAAPAAGGRRIRSRTVQSLCGWKVRSRLVRS